MNNLSSVNILCANGIYFAYEENNVLEDVTFTLKSGEITALLGANGCGKSTLFHVLTGRYKPQKGGVTLNGKNINEIKGKDFSKTVATVHQYNTAPPDLTVKELVEMGRTPYKGIFHKSNSQADENAVMNALEITDTAPMRNTPLSHLSGGQIQRVWLALALAQEPEILLLDEITTYLDIKYQYEILSLISRLNKENHLTVLMVLHDINQAAEFADNAVIMKQGKILVDADVKTAINRENIKNAFDIDADIVTFNGKQYFVMSKGEHRELSENE